MIYFDQAATSFPKPRGMADAMKDCMLHYCGNPGRSGHKMSMKMGEQIYLARKMIASLIGVKDPSRLIFTKNGTEGLNLAMRGILGEGDHVITTVMEHNSVLRPLYMLAQEGINQTIVHADVEGRIRLADIQSAVQDNTKLIVMTGASNVTGTLMPIEEVCKWAQAKGFLTLIDGAQCVGSLPLNVCDIGLSMLAFPGHKGLLGPQGTGCLYISSDVSLKPLLCGGTGTASKVIEQPLEFPDGFESGTVNGPGIIGLGYSAGIIEKIGIEAIRFHEQELLRELESYLDDMHFVTRYGPSPPQRTGICLLNLKGISSEEVSERLSREYGIAVRGGFHCAPLAHKAIGTFDEGAVRLSVGPFNTRKEIKYVADAIYRIGKSC